MLAAFAPLEVEGLEWIIVAEVEKAEAFAATTRLAQLMLLIVGLTIVSVLLVSPFFARRQAGPIIQARDVARSIAQGALDNKVEAAGEDEAAELLRALDEMQVDLRRRIQSEAEAAQNERIRTALDSVDAAVVAGHFELPKSAGASASTTARATHSHSARPAAPSRARSA